VGNINDEMKDCKTKCQSKKGIEMSTKKIKGVNEREKRRFAERNKERRNKGGNEN
jgi:hypothetical protein